MRSSRLAIFLVAPLLLSCATSPIPSTSPSRGGPSPPPSSNAVASASSSAPAVQSSAVGGPFPSSVLGMPVVSVADASSRAAEGKLDGRDIAVSGWYAEAFPPCPMLGVYFSPLDDYCLVAAFSDTAAEATACQSGSCQLGHTPMAPWLMTDTLGELSGAPSASDGTPVPIVVIGHTGDPRAEHCLPGNVARCKNEFVADRMAWANGTYLASTSEALRSNGLRHVSPSMTLSDVATLLGAGNQLLSAAAMTADDVRSLDPRWNRMGSDVMWVVRSIATPDAASADPTSAVTVALIDDATRQIVDTHPLALTPSFNPARLWVTETRHNVDANDDVSFGAFYRVDQQGLPIVDSELGDVYGNAASLVTGPDFPLLLDPGAYTLTAWLEHAQPQTGNSPSEPPIAECSTEQTLNAGDDVLLNAVYQQHNPCIWSNQEQPSFGLR